jgi:hypothetical protein
MAVIRTRSADAIYSTPACPFYWKQLHLLQQSAGRACAIGERFATGFDRDPNGR